MSSHTLDHAFKEFQVRVRASDLYDRTYWYYALYFLGVSLGAIISFAIIVSRANIFVQVVNAVFLAFVLVQGGMLGHDLTHQQVFRSRARNKWCAVFAWGIWGGLSSDKWFEKHNAHHKYVNQEGKDPDLDVPFVFSEKQAIVGLKKFILPHQHILFFLLLPLVYANMIVQAYKHLFRRFSPQNALELLLMTLHYAVLIGTVFYFLPLLTAVVFILVHFACAGTYMSLVFAPNHKGKDILEHDATSSWLHQIILTRNVLPSATVFHLLGGLNFQIEHHLFSDMARPKYWSVQKEVKKFCAQHQISYHETTWAQSLVEIYQSLKKQARRA